MLFSFAGHTHTALDQVFSRLSVHMWSMKRGVLTPQQLFDSILTCYKKLLAESAEFPTGGVDIKPEVQLIQKVRHYMLFNSLVFYTTYGNPNP